MFLRIKEKRCDLTGRPSSFVRPAGDIQTAKYILVGEQPGRREIVVGRPFVGPAGRVLDECLMSVGIQKSSCYFTNVIKDLDRPLSYYFKKPPSREPTLSDEGFQYFKSLEQELLQANPNAVVVPLGNVSLYATTRRYGITKWRGSVIKEHNRIHIPAIHPATVIPPKNVYTNKLLIQYDLQKAKRIIDEGYHPLERRLEIAPSFERCKTFLDMVLQQGLAGKTVDYDIEIHNEEVSCISFATSPTHALSIPFVNSEGDYFTVPQETEIWKRIARILEDQSIRKRGQNISFDAHFLLRSYGITSVNLDDTMIAQRTIMPDYPIGLDFITSIWTDMAYYKDEGKKFFKRGGRWETLWEYNARDSIVCADAFPKQFQKVVEQGNADAYERQRRVVQPLVYMQERGIRVDVDGMIKFSEKLGEDIEVLQDKLNSVAGQELNPNSPKQISTYFYGRLGLKPYKKKQGGAGATDEIAMKRLARRGYEEAKLILDIRHLRKQKGTYVPVVDGKLTKIDPDGRIRCSYNPVGTRFSRLSSSANIFGTGTNLQNWPHHLLAFLLADEGYGYFSFDLAQAENRIVAYVGQVTPMIDAFESGADVHSLTGALVSGIPYDEVRQQNFEDVPCHLGDGTKTWRFWGKKANHGLNYDLGYRKFALYYEIPERDAKFIVESYHSAYPGVRRRFHQYVKNCLSKDRTLVNLMGRHTLFLDKWEDKLFKDAYSCIPQGTVGDVINERGLNYVYYDQKQFGDIELLTQVHDSFGGQFKMPGWDDMIGWSHIAAMFDDMKRSLEISLSIHGMRFVVPADLTIGLNLYKGDSFEIGYKDWPESTFDLGILLRDTYRKMSLKKQTHQRLYDCVECVY
jgi:uracil-DNA glycosylase family 4